MQDWTLLSNPAPWHILIFGTLWGTEVFQSTIGAMTAFYTLERLTFAKLQSAIFPVYFIIQTLLPIGLAFTYPVAPAAVAHPDILTSNMPQGLATLLFDPTVRSSASIPLASKVVLGAVNMLIIAPACNRVLSLRKDQARKDGRKNYRELPHSAEAKKLIRRFDILHVLSVIINFVALMATVRYGWELGIRLR